MEHNDDGWWYIKEGKVDFDFTGWASNDAGLWYCEKGKVNFEKTEAMLQKKAKDILAKAGLTAKQLTAVLKGA